MRFAPRLTSMPTINPFPRTSRTGKSAGVESSIDRRYVAHLGGVCPAGSPPRRHRERRVRRRADDRTAAERRTVDPADSAIQSAQSVAPMGRPLANPFAVVSMSGVTPACSQAQKVPVRPRPVCISSNTGRARVGGHLAGGSKVRLRGGVDTALALYGFEEDGRRVVVDGVGQLLLVAVGDELHVVHEGFERRSELLLPRHRQRPHGPTVEAAFRGDDFDFPVALRANFIAASFASVPELLSQTFSRPLGGDGGQFLVQFVAGVGRGRTPGRTSVHAACSWTAETTFGWQ